MLQWFALRVKSHFEKSVAAAAHQKGFEEFLPLYQSRHNWSDRSKSLEVPLFPGYVFCRLEADRRFPLLTIPGVVHLVSTGKTPVTVDDVEISAIQNAIRSRLRVEPCPFVESGNQVRLGSGPLDGLDGFLIQVGKQHRFVVNLSALRRAVAVDIEREWVESAIPSASVATTAAAT